MKDYYLEILFKDWSRFRINLDPAIQQRIEGQQPILGLRLVMPDIHGDHHMTFEPEDNDGTY